MADLVLAKPARFAPRGSARRSCDGIALGVGPIGAGNPAVNQAGRKSAVSCANSFRRMNKDNPLWGAPRIHGELLKLGFTIVESTVSKYMVKHRGPPSQTWRTF